MRHGSATRADLERLARWLTVERPDLRPVIPQALDLVTAVSTSPSWAEARAGEIGELAANDTAPASDRRAINVSGREILAAVSQLCLRARSPQGRALALTDCAGITWDWLGDRDRTPIPWSRAPC